MITREEAEALAGAAAEHAEVLARTVVALYDERDALAGHRTILHEAATQGRAASESTAKALVAARAEVAALALELRRLRAAEAPGTDDEAFEGTGWERVGIEWVHRAPGAEPVRIYRFEGAIVDGGWRILWEPSRKTWRLALDAMRAAVPGSV